MYYLRNIEKGLSYMTVRTVLIEIQRNMKSASHIRLLLRRESLSVCLVMNNQQLAFIIHGERLEIIRRSDQLDIIIKGEEEEIQTLLRGITPLRALLRQGRIEAEGSYRNLLRLESVLFCSYEEMSV